MNTYVVDMYVYETVKILRHIGMHQPNNCYSLPLVNIVPVEHNHFQVVELNLKKYKFEFIR